MATTLTRERKVFLSILLVAGGALAVDRFTSISVGGSPALASANEYAVTPGQAATPLQPSQTLQTAQASHPAVPALAQQLQDAQSRLGLNVEQVSDAFTPGWDRPAPKSAEPVKPEPTPEQIASAFRNGHKLTGVMAAPGGGSIAIIDGKMFPQGGTLDGFTLVNVTNRLASLQGPGGARVTLELAKEIK